MALVGRSEPTPSLFLQSTVWAKTLWTILTCPLAWPANWAAKTNASSWNRMLLTCYPAWSGIWMSLQPIRPSLPLTWCVARRASRLQCCCRVWVVTNSSQDTANILRTIGRRRIRKFLPACAACSSPHWPGFRVCEGQPQKAACGWPRKCCAAVRCHLRNAS